MRDPSGQPQGIRWRLVPYVAPTGSCQVIDFLDALRRDDFKAYARFHEFLRPRFEELGPFTIGPPHWEGLGDKLYEIRWGYQRVYCSVENPRRIFMYLGVKKLWQKFKSKHRAICDRGRADVTSGEYDEEKREYLYRAHSQRRKNGNT